MPTPSYFEIALGIVCAGLLLLTAVAFLLAAKRRALIDAALKTSPSSEQLGTFDLSGKNAFVLLERKDPAIPEKLWTYDNFYLQKFAEAAEKAPLSGGTVLDLYFGPTLSWDIVFAVSLALFVALSEFAVATLLLHHRHEFIGCAVLFFACMGLVYGAADVAEDLKLAYILKDWRREEAAAKTHSKASAHDDIGDSKHEEVHIDGGEAAAANALTRIKFVAIFLSVLGAIVYGALSVIAAVSLRTPGSPTPSSPPQNPIPTAG
jgi:hypothetical protein